MESIPLLGENEERLLKPTEEDGNSSYANKTYFDSVANLYWCGWYPLIISSTLFMSMLNKGNRNRKHNVGVFWLLSLVQTKFVSLKR